MKLFRRPFLSGFFALCCVMGAALFSGCETPAGGESYQSQASQASPPPMPEGDPLAGSLIRVGDKVTIVFSDTPQVELPKEMRVREDGTIPLPLNVTVNAVGKTPAALEKEIEAEYVPKFYHRMTVAVKVEERVFYVKGQVRAPNQYIHRGQMTLLGAIALAGDFTDYAKKTAVEVTRADGTRIIVNCNKARKDARRDIAIYPGDIIEVRARFF